MSAAILAPQVAVALASAASTRPSTPGNDIHDMSEPVFDHHRYPELIDAILQFAPPQALLVLRGTDRHYRGRVDDMLFEHVIVCPPGADADQADTVMKGKGRERDSNSTAKPTVPGFDLRASQAPYPRLPLLPYDPSDEFDKWVLEGGRGERPSVSAASQGREDCREDIAGRIRVVDLYGRPHVPFPFDQAFMDLDILRRAADWSKHDSIAYAPAIVDFIDLGQNIHGIAADGALVIEAGDDVKRHVVHVGCPPSGDECVYSSLQFAPPPEALDLVLVFSMNPGAAEVRDKRSTATDADAPAAMTRNLFWEFLEYARSTVLKGGTATLVGIDSIELGDDVEHGFKSHLESHLENAVPSDDEAFETAEVVMTRIAFISHDEWRASLPEESVEFEAQWPAFQYGN